MTDTPEKDASPPADYLYVMLGASLFAFIQTFSLLSPILFSFLLILLISLAVNPMIARVIQDAIKFPDIIHARMSPVRSMGQIADLGNDFVQQKEFIRFATPQRCVAIGEHTVTQRRTMED